MMTEEMVRIIFESGYDAGYGEGRAGAKKDVEIFYQVLLKMFKDKGLLRENK